ncbi:hypothetical protein ACHAXT_012139 [Thalassiosira profunda]
MVPSSPASTNHQPQPHRAAHRASTLRQFANDDEEIDEEYELVEFFVSPEQISMLRKEASKRDRRKKLSKFFLSAEESKAISQETIEEINNLFDGSELIEVRGVSKDSKKQVFDAAHGLATTLEDAIEKPVVVVDIKGFAVKLYCPWDDEEREGRIQLRTSYKPGQWMRKAKPIRDNRGQIITGEDGKSIKEIPEY